jgi:electron transfer flavoprotein beta subunit
VPRGVRVSGSDIVVLVKPTPDITKVKFDVETGRVDRGSAELEINPFDLYALELAVRLRENVGGRVVALAMAPPHAEKALRDAIARGVDRAILLSDPKFAGADTLATSYTLAAAIRRLGNYRLILCGEKSVDGDTGQVGPEVAEHLGIPHAAFVQGVIDFDDESVTVEADFGDAYYQLRLNYPALLSVSRPLSFKGERLDPRIPKLSDLMKARKAAVEVWQASDVPDINLSRVGWAGSPTKVIKVFYALERGRISVSYKDPEEAVDAIINTLRSKNLL